MTELLINLISAFASVTGAISFMELLRKSSRKKITPKTYSERLSKLTYSLTTASAQVDKILRELSNVAGEKEQAVWKLESILHELEKREQELTKKIETLKKVPLPVAEHFAKLVEPSERRSAKRDYLLFGSGVIVTTLITIIIQVFSK